MGMGSQEDAGVSSGRGKEGPDAGEPQEFGSVRGAPSVPAPDRKDLNWSWDGGAPSSNVSFFSPQRSHWLLGGETDYRGIRVEAGGVLGGEFCYPGGSVIQIYSPCL